MKPFAIIVILINLLNIVFGSLPLSEENPEDLRDRIIANIISSNLKTNGWNTIVRMGHLSDALHNYLRRIPYPIVVTDNDTEDYDIEDVTPYHANVIILSCVDFSDYEDSMLKLLNSPYWHPHANIVIYYHQPNTGIIAKLFFSLWYYRAINVVLVQYNDDHKTLFVSFYTPYVNENYKLDNNNGCRTTRKIGMPVVGFEDGLVCEDTCQNVSMASKYREHNLGTCIGYNTVAVPYNDSSILENINLFEDKGKNLHGYTLRAYATEVQPFMLVDLNLNETGTLRLRSRDGQIWNTLSELMNFTLDLNSSVNVIKQQFNFEVNIKQIFSVAHRKGDVYLIPIYLFDVIVVELDFTFPFKDSGVCIMSHRAGFEMSFFNIKTLQSHYGFMIQSIICFLCIWFIFSAFKIMEKGALTLDQVGKDLVNTYRTVLMLTLLNPPRRHSFRLFLTVCIWSYFIIGFVTQATFISMFTALKRGKDVDTFEDVIEKGYKIEGMASPDLILPDTEERFRQINSKLVPVQDLFECVKHMTNDSRRFCLIDCSVGRYIQRNWLDENGEQYLHIAKDRIHSHYLNIILAKHSPLSNEISKYLITLFEAGLITKWEQYRYADIKVDVLTKPLSMADIKGLFHVYCCYVGIIFVVFLMELLTYYFKEKATFCIR